jgi:hypothetical protein
MKFSIALARVGEYLRSSNCQDCPRWMIAAVEDAGAMIRIVEALDGTVAAAEQNIDVMGSVEDRRIAEGGKNEC